MRSLKPYWHETARTLRAGGCTFPKVAAAVGRSVSAVKFLLHPEWKRRDPINGPIASLTSCAAAAAREAS